MGSGWLGRAYGVVKGGASNLADIKNPINMVHDANNHISIRTYPCQPLHRRTFGLINYTVMLLALWQLFIITKYFAVGGITKINFITQITTINLSTIPIFMHPHQYIYVHMRLINM